MILRIMQYTHCPIDHIPTVTTCPGPFYTPYPIINSFCLGTLYPILYARKERIFCIRGAYRHC